MKKTSRLFKTVLICITFLTLTPILSQNNQDFSIARVGERIHGVYIFMNAEPVNQYDHIATISIKVNWTGNPQESFDKIIKKAQKKYPYFNGMIFRNNNYMKVDLIKFKDLGTSRGGFAIGDKVSFIKTVNFQKVQVVGEVIELESSKNKASIKYRDDFGVEKIEKVDYGELTKVQ